MKKAKSVKMQPKKEKGGKLLMEYGVKVRSTKKK